MADYITSSKALILVITVTIVAALVGGIVGYNMGLSQALDVKTINNTTNLDADNLNNNAVIEENNNNTGGDTNQTETEVSMDSEIQTVGNTSKLEGTISKLTSDGFTLSVTTSYYNAALKQVTSKNKDFNILVDKQTKITENIYQVTIPPGGGMVQTKTTTKTLRIIDLKEGQVVEVTTTSKTTDTKLVASQIVITTTIKR